MSGRSAREGTTLLELMVVLLILALLAGLSAGTLSPLRPIGQASGDSVFAQARLRAVGEGVPVRVQHEGRHFLFLPDGRALGEGLDPLTGSTRRDSAR